MLTRFPFCNDAGPDIAPPRPAHRRDHLSGTTPVPHTGIRWVAVAWLLAAGSGILSAASPELDFFERKIRPVLAEHCYECHSAESKSVKGGLRLDSGAALRTGGDTGPAVVPGKPADSLLIKALAHADPDLAMPPKKPQLPASIRADFEQWIAAGAPWPDEPSPASPKPKFDLQARKKSQAWLWQTPVPSTPPTVRNADWPLSPIDQFILHRLEEKGLAPAPATDDRTWLRRVSFAITGLPPSRQEIQEFLADTSPGARERVVERLLASPHFGERWARHWMDLMRYAETRGHESDFGIANAWQYRDYLIRAFNSDVPYPQFLQEHLAGDLLPTPRFQAGTGLNESVLGTGWAFLGEEVHSPVDIRQDECERLDNKVDVFTKAFLGLTVACARCHDHKFDPISAADYYALSGFFLGSSYRQVRFETMENNRQMASELAQLRDRELPPLAGTLAAARRSGVQEMARYLVAAAAPTSEAPAPGLNPDRVQHWRRHLELAAQQPGHLLHGTRRWLPTPATNTPPAAVLSQALTLPEGARIVADYTRPDAQPWKADGEGFGRGPLRPGDLVSGTNATQALDRVMTYGAARRDAFWKPLKLTAGNESDSGRLAATSRAGQMVRTPGFTLSSGRLHYLIRGKTLVYAAVDSHLMIEGPLHGKLMQKFDTGAATDPQWITHDLSEYSGHRAHVEFGPDGDADLEILMVVESPEVPRGGPHSTPFQPSQEPASLAAFAAAAQNAALEACDWLERRSRGPVAGPVPAWVNWVLQNPDLLGDTPSDTVRQASARYREQEAQIARRVQWESRTAVAWFDGTGVDEHVLIRGKPFKPGALAPRSLPTAFDGARPLTNAASSGRYELALQLTDPDNPLVARVLVNRVWHHLFGRGIVPTVDNFGTLGEPPTHPELLDYLAWQFVHEDRGSVKRLIRRLALTQTFAMSHRAADPRADELDPNNALWHRIPIRRLEAEIIRDALLTVSGRLNPTVGGPPVPVHLTEFVVGRGRPDKSGPLDGDGRRSIYTTVRRNFLPTLMLTFDSPTPFSTVGRRNVTNVPAQSLALMNDPLFHEQARIWAARLLAEQPGAGSAARIAWLFETAYGRLPTPDETAACLESLAELRQFHPAGESSVEMWADLCHALLNANDFIYVM